MKTKIYLVLLSLGLASASAYAGTIETAPMPISNDINVTAPDQSGMWSFGATAVLMQPTNKDFNYADGAFQDSPIPSNQSIDHYTVNEDYDWWFGADITYAIPGHGRDVTLAYEGLHGTDSDSTSTDTLGSLHSSFSGEGYLTAEGETNTRYDAGDLLFGQKLDVGERIRLHPFIGLRYAHIDADDTGTYTGGQDGGGIDGGMRTQFENSTIDNTFNGIGPRFGTDAQINLGQGFSIRGRLGLSALIGSRSIDDRVGVTYYNLDGTFSDAGTITIADQSETHVIPEIDGRLGLNYTTDFNSNTALGFELGWQATNYFNIISNQPSLSDVVNSGGGQPQNAQPSFQYSNTSNFGIQGPYARIQLDVA